MRRAGGPGPRGHGVLTAGTVRVKGITTTATHPDSQDSQRGKLAARPNMWTEAPGLHLEFGDRAVEAVFDGRRICVSAAELESDVMVNALQRNTPYADRSLAVADAFATVLFRKLAEEFAAGQHGSWSDAKLMAEKARQKAARVPQFVLWIVHMS